MAAEQEPTCHEQVRRGYPVWAESNNAYTAAKLSLWKRLVAYLTGRPFALNLPVSGAEQRIGQYEQLTVRCVAPGRYKLLYSPSRVQGLAAGDVFVLAPKEECGFRVVKRGANVCVWFDFDARYDNDSPEAMELCRSVEALGGRVDGKGAFSLTFTVPSSAGLATIDDLPSSCINFCGWPQKMA